MVLDQGQAVKHTPSEQEKREVLDAVFTPLTPSESRAEYAYRLKERLGLMSPDAPPTEEEFLAAQAAAMKEVRELKEVYAGNAARV